MKLTTEGPTGNRTWLGRRRARAIAAFMTAVPVTGLIGGPTSGLLLGLKVVSQQELYQLLHTIIVQPVLQGRLQ